MTRVYIYDATEVGGLLHASVPLQRGVLMVALKNSVKNSRGANATTQFPRPAGYTLERHQKASL